MANSSKRKKSATRGTTQEDLVRRGNKSFDSSLDKTITIDGHLAVTVDRDNRVTQIDFLPDLEDCSFLEQGYRLNGSVQLLRSGWCIFVADRITDVSNHKTNI